MKFSLSGWKTYIVGVALFVLGGLYGIGVVDRQFFEMGVVLLAGLGTVSMRTAIKKVE